MKFLNYIKIWFLRVPPNIKPVEKSFYYLVKTGTLFGMCYHVLVSVFWYYAGVQEMVFYHFFGIPLLGVGYLLSLKGKLLEPVLIFFLEYLLHGILGTYYAGWGSGMHYPIIMLSMAGTLYPGKHKIFVRWISSLSFVIYIFLIYFFYSYIPIYQLSAQNLILGSMLMAFSFVIVIGIFMIFQSTAARWYKELEIERGKTRHLLLNILPEQIADRLISKEDIIADRFDEASVLFLDIVNFTELGSKMQPNILVEFLNEIFCIFDNLTTKYGIEKIKTIGDGYMVVSGVPESDINHAAKIVEMAQDMIEALSVYSIKNNKIVRARIGICSGPVVAGVIGKQKFLYDLWGDTVNMASRMESHGTPDRIQVTESTYNVLKDSYLFEERGLVDIKGKGKLKTYYLCHDIKRDTVNLSFKCPDDSII